MSLRTVLNYGEYKVLLTKRVSARVEHLASVYHKYTHAYGEIFVTFHVFDRIPLDFREIYKAIRDLGPKVDGKSDGLYLLNLRGHGEGAGKIKAGVARISYNRITGFKIREVRAQSLAFRRMLRTHKRLNAQLREQGRR